MNLIPRPVSVCCEALRSSGHEAYPVGGCVRDLLLGRPPSDWDVTTSALPETVTALFDKTVPTGLRHGTVSVFLDGMKIEVTTFRRESAYSDGRHPDQVSFDATLTDDLSRRDFTINAMALDASGGVVDPFGGRQDLDARVIRCVGTPEQRFGEDALRMFRALRFAAQLDFSISTDVTEAVALYAQRARSVSAERVRTELEKAICAPFPGWADGLFSLGLMDRFLLKRASPELGRLSEREPHAPARWSALCGLLEEEGAISGRKEFLSSLRLERRVIREILNDGAAPGIRDLALSGGAMYRMGLRGPEIGAAQRRLLAHVRLHPQDNTADDLIRILNRGD
ncbi:MAG: tRNA nucleotidyltransferase [Oscillospiraceae bacterium]|nr:tRNA nucleotidyltransferase [Oscillospiraceae bacterium]